MSRIRILPDILSNKIAAGEVVERPASVVKELVENALDAGATRIFIDIEEGGRKLVQVSDNGTGMNRDDALLSIERYATSKLHDDPDLFAIRTLGFRGEALPSIAAVSRFTLETRETGADAGVRVEVEGGRLKHVTDAGLPVGTLVAVRQLFFNTPARRKFLKAVSTEMSHIADTVASLALGWPAVAFRLTHNDRVVSSLAATATPEDRVTDILGRDVAGHLLPLSHESEDLTLSGWVVPAHLSRSTTAGIHVIVNGRYVRDRMVRHALLEGYAGRLMKGRFPAAALFLTLPPELVDVNVHPSKHEVRFANHREVYRAVVVAVGGALRGPLPPAPSPGGGDHGGRFGVFVEKSSSDEQATHQHVGFSRESFPDEQSPRHDSGFSEESFPYEHAPSRIAPERPHRSPPPLPGAGGGGRGLADKAPQIAESRSLFPQPDAPPRPTQSSLWASRRFSDLRIIGQFHGTYILLEAPDAILAVDQHAAHERVVFEDLRRRAASGTGAVQRLLMPETVDLSHQEADALLPLIERLARAGLEIEPFGGTTVKVTALPPVLAGRDPVRLVRDLAEKAVSLGVDTDLGAVLEECLHLMACHTAVRANAPLTELEIRALLAGLDDCENPSHCPHGRPTWIRWELREIEKTFRRVV